MAIGCLAETFSSCNAGIPVYFNDFITIVLKNSNTSDSKCNRNCAFGIGVLAEYG